MRNRSNLRFLTERHQPDLIFLTKPQIFSCDVENALKYFSGTFCYYLNSEDKYTEDLPMKSSKANGGTMLLWKRELDPYVTIDQDLCTPAFLPLFLNLPGFTSTIHISVYLPTSGRDDQFMEDLSTLSSYMDKVRCNTPDMTFYLRGDFNVNEKNQRRTDILNSFIKTHNLQEMDNGHLTYHHFMGNGESDSKLDRIFTTSLESEMLDAVICRKNDPLIDSHHDVLISRCCLLEQNDYSTESHLNYTSSAPRVTNSRHKIMWTDEGVRQYQNLVPNHLIRLQETWLQSPSKSCVSLLFSATSDVLTSCAKASNKYVSLSSKPAVKQHKVPHQVRSLTRQVLKLWNYLKRVRLLHNADSDEVQNAVLSYKHEKYKLRKLNRHLKALESIERDSKLLNNPKLTFNDIRRFRNRKGGKVGTLYVGDRQYHGKAVPDGFFDSVQQLKTKNHISGPLSTTYAEYLEDYSHIMKLLDTAKPMKTISEKESFDILMSMKATVADFYSVTPLHYIYAGPLGWKHFHLLLNQLILDVNCTTIVEVNRTYACILFKGHSKNKQLAKSYRTISTCPVIAKALDVFLRNQFCDSWYKDQAPTQFQGQGSSHELAALLLTECILHSSWTLKEPLFALYLDARSAFDVVQKEMLVRNLFHVQQPDQALKIIDNRLTHRDTILDWEGTFMGPINDQQGLEQGGVNSSEYYKIYGKEQLSLPTTAALGVPLGNLVVSAIGQADDTVLVSNDIVLLSYLLELNKVYCKNYLVELGAEKTKLQMFPPSGSQMNAEYAALTNPIKINNFDIPFSSTADHVGVLRSITGNGPTILARFSAHRRALSGIMHVGLGKGHRGNPALGLRVEKLYAAPVLLSGLASLKLSRKEVMQLDQHYCETLRQILRLERKTPQCVIYFLAGSLPGSALLHIRQLGLFGMITRLSGNVLNLHARNIYSSTTISKKSWFHDIRDLCLLYGLPHPSLLLEDPIGKYKYKKLVKSKVIDYWECVLRQKKENLKSLTFFHPHFMSLTLSHPIFTSSGHSPLKVAMARVQALMLSGRYRFGALVRHWTRNYDGTCCLSPQCRNNGILEDIHHVLQFCPALEWVRTKMMNFTLTCSLHLPNEVKEFLLLVCTPNSSSFCHFLLDCSSLPQLRDRKASFRSFMTFFFDISRTWVYVLHR